MSIGRQAWLGVAALCAAGYGGAARPAFAQAQPENPTSSSSWATTLDYTSQAFIIGD